MQSRKIDGRTFRFIFEKLKVNGHAYTVEMGVPADDAVETLRFVPIVSADVRTPAVAGGCGRRLLAEPAGPVSRGRTGANRARGRAERISAAVCQKLDTGDELQRLSDTLNEMLERIESAFLRITQFTADASHELRTPVSLIRTEAELALASIAGRSRIQGVAAPYSRGGGTHYGLD